VPHASHGPITDKSFVVATSDRSYERYTLADVRACIFDAGEFWELSDDGDEWTKRTELASGRGCSSTAAAQVSPG